MDRGIRAPVVIEAAGAARAFETALALTAPGGTTVTVGLPAPDARASVSPLVLTAEARTIVGSYLGSAVPSRDIPRYVEPVARGTPAARATRLLAHPASTTSTPPWTGSPPAASCAS